VRVVSRVEFGMNLEGLRNFGGGGGGGGGGVPGWVWECFGGPLGFGGGGGLNTPNPPSVRHCLVVINGYFQKKFGYGNSDSIFYE